MCYISHDFPFLWFYRHYIVYLTDGGWHVLGHFSPSPRFPNLLSALHRYFECPPLKILSQGRFRGNAKKLEECQRVSMFTISSISSGRKSCREQWSLHWRFSIGTGEFVRVTVNWPNLCKTLFSLRFERSLREIDRMRPVNWVTRAKLSEELAKNWELGFLEPSKSPDSATIVACKYYFANIPEPYIIYQRFQTTVFWNEHNQILNSLRQNPRLYIYLYKRYDMNWFPPRKPIYNNYKAWNPAIPCMYVYYFQVGEQGHPWRSL